MEVKTQLSVLGRAFVVLSGSIFSQQTIMEGGTLGDFHLWHDGLKRSYVFYIPDDLPLNEPVPLVLGFHAGWRDAQRLVEEGMGGPMNQMADEYKFIAVYPDGFGRYKWWNDCRNDATLAIGFADDVGFVEKLISNFSNAYNIDPERIYAWGQSNGGMMCYRLGQELSHKIAAVAGINASQPFYNSCPPPENPISVLVMNGTDDVHLPFEGGFLEGFRSLGRVLSAENTVNYWRYYNQTSEIPVLTNLTDYVLEDGPSNVVLKSYLNGIEGTEVAFYQVNGGGHTAPGTGNETAFKLNLFGWTNMDINGAYHVWSFFERHRLNGPALGEMNPVKLSSYSTALSGDWLAGNNESFFWNDDHVVVIGGTIDPELFVEFEVPDVDSLTSLRIQVRSFDSEVSGVTRSLSVLNQVTGSWDSVASDSVEITESTLEVSLAGDLNQYLDGQAKVIQISVLHEHPSAVHDMSVDQVLIEVNQ